MTARVLIVEDENIIAKDIEHTLVSMGYGVCGVASRAEAALRMAEQTRPDVVLMDIRLRGEMDGIEAARRMREEVQVPVVFLTAHADEATLQRAKVADPYGYVLKPFDEKDLHVALTVALRKHRAVAALDHAVQQRTRELARSEIRYRRMFAVAELGLAALRTTELQPILDEALRIAAETLGNELVALFEELQGSEGLVVRAVRGWPPELLGTRIPAEKGSQAGYTLLTREPLVISDLTRETRFQIAPMVRAEGAVSAMTVIVHSAERPYGVLAAHSRTHRDFSVDDVDFLQAVANVIASAVARHRVEEQLRDTERAAEEERQRVARAQQAVRERDEFLTVASHELRTPLTALQLQLQLLVRSLTREENRVPPVEGLKKALDQSRRVAALVERLLDVSALRLGKLKLSLGPVDVAGLVSEVVEHWREQARAAGCEVRLEIASRPEATWDRLRIEQVLDNLLSNAIKYGPGKPVDVALRSGGSRATLTVRDRGIGIAPEEVPRIFERFARAVPVSHYGGLGLGLYIARQLVEAHGGSIRATCDGGAIFTVELPLRAPPS